MSNAFCTLRTLNTCDFISSRDKEVLKILRISNQKACSFILVTHNKEFRHCQVKTTEISTIELSTFHPTFQVQYIKNTVEAGHCNYRELVNETNAFAWVVKITTSARKVSDRSFALKTSQNQSKQLRKTCICSFQHGMHEPTFP